MELIIITMQQTTKNCTIYQELVKLLKKFSLKIVEKNANTDEIKKAYKKKAQVHHPDRGGDKEKFQEVNEAYEVLSNAERRQKYDKYGEDGIKGGARGAPADMDDIFSIFFGARGI